MTLSYKQQFQKTKFHKVHADLVRQEHFLTALHYALLEYIWQQAPQKDEYLDACCATKIAGVRQFIDVFLNLSEPRIAPKSETKTNLQHTV
jgi:hypothetical protein